MITYGCWLYDELRPAVGLGKSKTRFNMSSGYFHVNVSSTRLELFRMNPKCATCKLRGEVWLLQSHGELGTKSEMHPHLNLFAINSKDQLILMTQDHIMPKAAGGSDSIQNLQTMCYPCNQRKGAIVPINIRMGYSYPTSIEADEQYSSRDIRDLAERSFREQRLRTLSAYADFLAADQKLSA